MMASSLSSYDAVHGRFGEAELSGNDPDAVTLPMQLSNLLAVDNHLRSAKCFSLRRSSGPAPTVFFGVRPGAEFEFSCVVLRTLAPVTH
jgi:hypothetical protein